MIKRELKYYLDKIDRVLSKGDYSVIALLDDGRILKVFDINYLLFLKQIDYNIEKQLVNAMSYDIPTSIKKPLEFVYESGLFCGYIMERAKGISFNERNDLLSINDRLNLSDYAVLHNNLEKVIRESKKLVFPDLLTCDNIFVDKDKNIELIDFDGIQVGNNKVLGVSSSLRDLNRVQDMSKYWDKQKMLFTKELDVKSLIHLYFLDVFNMDLSRVGVVNPIDGKRIMLDDFFRYINLDDYDIMHKVWKVFEGNQKNEYLGDDVFRLAEDYNVIIDKNYHKGNIYLKKLVRKR